MPDEEERMAKLSARVSHDAWLQLKRMRHHPQFGAVLTRLEAIEGTINDADVRAAQKLLGSDNKN